MQISYKNKRLERFLIGFCVLTAVLVAATFVLLFGFDRPLLPGHILYALQAGLLCIFLLEKLVRIFNATSKAEYLWANWFELPLLLGLGIVLFASPAWFARFEPTTLRHFAIGIYLVVEVIGKLCRTVVNLAAAGKNPTQVLIASFLVLIISGAGLLMLPKSAAGENTSFIDALFTATSATCVTGLIVKDTGQDFSLMGKIIILTLIQLGGLGIVVFGAVFALLLGQALSFRESVAMQDLLSAKTLGRIGNMIVFIFFGTILIEAIGALSIFRMWDNIPSWSG
ncbi:MAG: hypothetical protein JXB29_10370, partial [Sedimentisphaerales bacterium]|nr:hypothetical protein [Sedimentisphaerales bacterium]